jgi:hypothetical protein
MADRPSPENNFTYASPDPQLDIMLNPFIDKPVKRNKSPEPKTKFGRNIDLSSSQKLGIAKMTKNKKEELSQQEYQPLFRQLKNEYPPKSYGHGYHSVNLQAYRTEALLS